MCRFSVCDSAMKNGYQLRGTFSTSTSLVIKLSTVNENISLNFNTFTLFEEYCSKHWFCTHTHMHTWISRKYSKIIHLTSDTFVPKHIIEKKRFWFVYCAHIHMRECLMRYCFFPESFNKFRPLRIEDSQYPIDYPLSWFQCAFLNDFSLLYRSGNS